MIENIGNTEAVGSIAGILIAGAIWLRKLKPSFASDDKAVAAAQADIGIIERLEKECKRLSEQNDKLSSSLNTFQLQILTFQTENQKLSLENSALKEENVSLREEIIELRTEVQELGKELIRIQRSMPNCSSCEYKK